MRRVKHVFIARLVTGIVTIAMVIAMIIPLVIFFATGAKDKGIGYVSLIFVVPFALSLFGFFLTLALRTKKYECGGKTYYAHNGFFIVELYEEDKLIKRLPSILTPPDIDYTDENGNKVFVEFGSFLGISLKFNGEKVKASPAKYKDVRKQNKN